MEASGGGASRPPTAGGASQSQEEKVGAANPSFVPNLLGGLGGAGAGGGAPATAAAALPGAARLGSLSQPAIGERSTALQMAATLPPGLSPTSLQTMIAQSSAPPLQQAPTQQQQQLEALQRQLLANQQQLAQQAAAYGQQHQLVAQQVAAGWQATLANSFAQMQNAQQQQRRPAGAAPAYAPLAATVGVGPGGAAVGAAAAQANNLLSAYAMQTAVAAQPQPQQTTSPYFVPVTNGAPGAEPAAKRQAVAAPSAAESQAQMWAFINRTAQTHFGGDVTKAIAYFNAARAAQQQLAAQAYGQWSAAGARTVASGYGMPGAGAAAAAPASAARGQMRVVVDKRSRAAYDGGQFVAEDTSGRDHADAVLRKVEEVSRALKQQLGRAAGAAAEGDAAGAAEAVTQAALIEACGNAARYLKPYQVVGINFLLLLRRTRVGGAILADEMGLGKTAQLITYLGALRGGLGGLAADKGPHLVAVPASLLENWQRELRRWCPALRVVVYYGRHRGVVRARLADMRARLLRGEEVPADEVAALSDPDRLAELAADMKEAEAEALAREDDDGEGGGTESDEHEGSDDDFDYGREEAREKRGGAARAAEAAAAAAAAEARGAAPALGAAARALVPPFDVMLTCYTLFERDSPDQRADRAFVESWAWSHLVMDEAHALKNAAAQRTTRLRRVANLAAHRVMMTGTPLQNDLEELQNLLHFLLPSVFGAEGLGADLAAAAAGDEGQERALTERCKQMLTPFVLRRMKAEVAGQLTEKRHATEFVAMTPEQTALYESAVQQMRDQVAAATKSAATRDDAAKFAKQLGAKKVTHIFTHLRKIAQHPLLVRHHYDDAKVAEIARKAFAASLFAGATNLRRVQDELSAYSDYSLHAFCYNAGPDFASYRLGSAHLMSSAKFVFLRRLLPELKAKGSRPLIFSQWTAVLDCIEWLMDELRLPYVRLDGSTAVDERLATVDRFNTCEDVFAFLLSTRAGGQGLNLTGADTVVLHDVDFNPQIDRQAEDRCHRLGQTRPVSVYRLVARGTVDQNIYNISQRKLRLDAAVLDGITSGAAAASRDEKAAERNEMGAILHALFAGKGGGVEATPGELEAAEAEERAREEEERRAREAFLHKDDGVPAVAADDASAPPSEAPSAGAPPEAPPNGVAAAAGAGAPANGVAAAVKEAAAGAEGVAPAANGAASSPPAGASAPPAV